MKSLKLIAAFLAAASMAAIPSVSAETPEKAPSKGDIKLAKMLEGRVAGDPQKCISGYRQVDLTVIDGTALVYKKGRTLYVNVPKNPRSLDDRDALVRRTSFGNRLCNTDIISTIEPTSGHYTGNVILGEFVPYRKPETS